MAYTQGGWKAVQVSWVAGQKYATGTAQDVYDLMNDIKTAILSVNIWELDPAIHTGTSANAPLLMDNTNNKWTHGLFFYNKQSGSKMCLTYTYTGSSFHSAKRALCTTWSGDNYFGGLCCSLIPPNSGSFDPTAYSGRGFIPDKGIPIQSAFMSGYGNGTGTLFSALNLTKTAGTTGWASYTFLMKDDVIGCFLTSSYINSGTVTKGAYYGHIFDDDKVPCPELEDDLPASNYGMVHLFPCSKANEFEISTNNNTGYGFSCLTDLSSEVVPCRTVTSGGGGGSILRRTASMTTMTDNDYYSILSGCWITQMPTGFGIAYPYYSNPQLQTNSSDRAVFSEVVVTAAVADNTVESARYFKGDSTKAVFGAGTLRGDILLVGNNKLYTRGQTFGNKKYIYIGGCVAVGWDPDIEITLFN